MTQVIRPASVTLGIVVAACLLLVGSPPIARSDEKPTAEASATAAPPLHVVEPIDLPVVVRRDGRIDTNARSKVRFAPEAVQEQVRVLEIVKRNGAVQEGDALVRLDPRPFEVALRAARESVDDAERQFNLTRQEQQVSREATAVTLERARSAFTAAEHAQQRFAKSEGANMLRGSELSVMGMEHNLADQREELDQLEKMYQGTELSPETKEIVLERARRGVGMTQSYLGIVRDNAALVKEFGHPDRQRDITNQLKWTTTELTHAEIHAALAEIRAVAAIEATERAVREARERLEKVERDSALRVLSAPAAGLLAPIELQPGDVIGPQYVISEVADPRELVVKFSAVEDDLRIVAVGTKVVLITPAIAERELNGTVSELSGLGTFADNGATFPAVVTIEGPVEKLRIGQRCTVMATTTLPEVLAIPRKAIETRSGRHFCKVRRDGRDEEVEIRIGLGNDDLVQVVGGLTSGDAVILPEKN